MTDRQWSSYTATAQAAYYRSGQTDYDTGTGFWIGDDSGVPKLSIGNSAGNKVTWDGTTLSITGTITATTGTIGGWTLAATYLTSGSGATTVRLDSAGTNPAISAGNATPGSAPFRVTQAGALTATSATITGAITATSGSFTGGITVGAGGSLSSGQSAYDTGTGYWLEYNSGTPRFSIGNSAGNKLTWSGTVLAITGSMSLTNSVQTFTPAWVASDFSGSDPAGDLSYLNFGAYAMIWNDSGADMVGTSDSPTLGITNIPAAIRPSSHVRLNTSTYNNTAITFSEVLFDSSGVMNFYTWGVSGTSVTGLAGFTGSGTKGLPSGWLVVYPL